MYRGFNLKITNEAFKSNYNVDAKEQIDKQKIEVETTLNKFATSNGGIDASKIQDHWFPQIKNHVFISHSHKDEKTAISLAGFLKYEFGIDSFIDSCVWGYSDRLLKIIDNNYCFNTESETYDYGKRNRSTSHVHMMLSTALSMMMDKSECLIFLNTPSSISANATINGGSNTTKSPWIYSELAMTKLIRTTQKYDHRNQIQKMAKAIVNDSFRESEFPTFHFDAPMNHLIDLSESEVQEWYLSYDQKNPKKRRPLEALDMLYSLKKAD